MCVNGDVRSDADLLLSVVQESSDSSNTTIEDEDVKGECCLFRLHFIKAIRHKSPCIHSDFTKDCVSDDDSSNTARMH